ncbi:TonB-dependent receptor, partial [Flavobacteriaceae bacterium]|nr:TonB-dependent receptor [Flavobacteriaceae bacterium]
FFKYNNKIVDIFDFDEGLLSIFSRDILQKIKNKENGWETELPNGIAELIKSGKMLGFEE